MKRIFSIIIILSILLASSCVRKPSSYGMVSSREHPSSQMKEDVVRANVTGARPSRSTRASRVIHSVTHDNSLPSKVLQLANQVERKFKTDSYTADDLERWANLYVEYTMEYYLSTQNLTDEQCESIEFNLGKIAGSVYKDGIVPVINEIEKIGEGLEDYEERSQKWAGAVERGFKSVAGDTDSDW